MALSTTFKSCTSAQWPCRERPFSPASAQCPCQKPLLSTYLPCRFVLRSRRMTDAQQRTKKPQSLRFLPLCLYHHHPDVQESILLQPEWKHHSRVCLSHASCSWNLSRPLLARIKACELREADGRVVPYLYYSIVRSEHGTGFSKGQRAFIFTMLMLRSDINRPLKVPSVGRAMLWEHAFARPSPFQRRNTTLIDPLKHLSPFRYFSRTQDLRIHSHRDTPPCYHATMPLRRYAAVSPCRRAPVPPCRSQRNWGRTYQNLLNHP